MTTPNQNGEEYGDVFFTILPSDAGFTDQLFQFNVFYKLGRHLGYRYLHSDYKNKRNGSENIYDFLGFNSHFTTQKLTSKTHLYRAMGLNNCVGDRPATSLKGNTKKAINAIKFKIIQKLAFRELNFIDVGLNDDTPHDETTDLLSAFQGLMRDILKKHVSKTPKIKNVVRFNLVEGRYFFLKLAPYVSHNFTAFPDGLDLRAICLDQNANHHLSKSFTEDPRLKILVHIRLGDTATINTAWGTFIPLWAGNSLNPLREFSDKTDKLFLRTIDESDFVIFLKKLASAIEPGTYVSKIFSDGYKTAFREVLNHAHELNLDRDQVAALKRDSKNYETERFSVFDEINFTDRAVGETNDDLNNLVYSCLFSDIIIIGCNQRMLPKLLANYCNTTHPALIISLYKEVKPDYEMLLGLDNQKANVFPINITQTGISEEMTALLSALKFRFPENMRHSN